MKSGRHFDWASLLRFGVGRLRLTPEQFWALTPIEFALMAGTDQGDRPMNREKLAELCARFPDVKKGAERHVTD